MAIREKPQMERAIRAVINQGGDVASEDSRDITHVKLRVPRWMLKRIDTEVRKRKIRPSRHHYILEAIMAYLSEEE